MREDTLISRGTHGYRRSYSTTTITTICDLFLLIVSPWHNSWHIAFTYDKTNIRAQISNCWICTVKPMLNTWWKVKSVFRSHYFVDARWSLNANGQPLYTDTILWTPSWVYVLVNNYVCKRCIDGGITVLAKCMSLKSDPHLNVGQLTKLSSTLGILAK